MEDQKVPQEIDNNPYEMSDNSYEDGSNPNNENKSPYENNDENRKPNINRNVLLFYLLGFALILIFNWIIIPKIAESRIVPANYSQFRSMVENKKVTEVSFEEDQILFIGVDDNAKKTIYKTGKMDDPDIINLLEKNNVDYAATIPEKPNMFLSFLLTWGLPILLIFVLSNTMQKRIKGMQGGLFSKKEIKKYEPTSEKITFADVAGQEEAVDSLKEIVDYLKNPGKYSKVGAKCPKGALLVGPPGTGKTLIAKAVAGESHVPFYSMAGSEFVEMFVGRGAAKVRDLFDEAKKNAPCIIFIDEIDTIGKSRDTSGISSNDEREQTLNQLLTEMDGFDGNIGIVVLAATNRPEVLDPALLRPGRFDRQIRVELPSLQDRVAILKVHAKDYVTEDNIDYDLIARSTAGASGAQLANIMNEAALRTVREGQDKVRLVDIQESVEVVIAGEQRKQDILSPEEKEIVAYHEIGHALVAALQTNSPPVQKITIIPRTSGALGYTMQVPESEKNLYSKEDFETHITTLCGGRAAEEVFFNTMTNGASNDIERATSLAKSMVTQYGMTERFGMVKLQESGSRYMGDEGSMVVSQQTMKEVEDIVVSIINQCHEKARELIRNNKEAMTKLSNYLLENETITGDEFMEIFEKYQV